ncbi:MAG: hypothetical protein M1156_01335 [Candidatus Marsarchaeota archaeon]|jgi:hypothetical protein|nr:hypothetical protein [Candidatus Marsarchaeota archaeon]
MAVKKYEIALIVAVALVAVVILYIVFGNRNSTALQNTTITTVATSSTTSVGTTITVTPPSTSTIQSYQGCLARTNKVNIYNGNFSTGNFIGWNVTGTGFGSAPINITYENSNSVNGYFVNNNYTNANKWTGYNGIFFASTYQGGLSISPGNISSQVFEVTEPYLNFQIASPQNNNIYVEILKNGQPVERAYYNTFGENGGNYHIFMNESMNLAPLMCSNVSVRVVADVISTPATHYDFIAIGGFYLSRTPYPQNTGLVNQSLNLS